MDYIIFRKTAVCHPWVRFGDGQIFLTADRAEVNAELRIEKELGDAVVVSLKYDKVTPTISKCTAYLGHKKLGIPFFYKEDSFFDTLETNLHQISLGIK